MAETSDGVIAAAGHLAAGFARQTAERLIGRHPAARQAEHLARSGVAEAVPGLSDSLARLLAGITARTRRPASPLGGTVNGPRPISPVPENIGTPADTQRKAARLHRPPRHQSRPETPALEALDTSLAMLRRLPPVALRNALLQQSGIGEGLDIRLRARLQPHVRFDPAAARLHRGALAAAAAQELDAEAFTIGPDIFFAAGRFAPHTRDGIGLLAHEVMHVGQQTAAVGDRMRFFTPHGGDAMEREAQNAAASALSADTAETKNRVGGGLHQAAAPPKPAFAFALPLTGGMSGIRPVPAQTATEESGTSEAKSAPDKADARAVADRVYDLLKQEIAAGRLRGGARRKG